MLNKVFLIGRLTKDPELRYTPGNNVPVTNFTLAVDRNFLNQQGEREADFIRIVAWRKLAEIVCNNLGKGRLICVEGRLQIRNYETETGEKRFISEVVADNIVFLDYPKDSKQSETSSNETPSDTGFDNDFNFDEIPF